MDKVLPGLYGTTNPQSLSFARSLGVKSFLIVREEGNILVYGSASVEGEEDSVRELGGVWRQYLNHSHEALVEDEPGIRFREALDFPVHAHEDERPEVSNHCALDGAFSERHRAGNDFEIIPTPGHTPGATAFLWDSGEHRVLFTGDTIFLKDGEWVTALLDSSDREKYIQSLELIRNLDFDVLAPWGASIGGDSYVFTDREDSTRRLDALIEEMRGK